MADTFFRKYIKLKQNQQRNDERTQEADSIEAAYYVLRPSSTFVTATAVFRTREHQSVLAEC